MIMSTLMVPGGETRQETENPDKHNPVDNEEKVEGECNRNPLQSAYCFWFSEKTPTNKVLASATYGQHLKKIGVFSTVQDFWRYYTHMLRPNNLPKNMDFHMFKKGIQPMWEDEANRKGGKWILKVKKGIASRYWENLLLAVIGEQFLVGDEICGCVISVRHYEDILSIWNRTSANQAVRVRIRDTIQRVLNLPPNTVMEYKCHAESLKDNTSYRNTDVPP